MSEQRMSGRQGEEVLRRLLDIVAAFCGLVVLGPVFGIIAVAIKIDSPGSAYYQAERIGKDGKPFTLYKFRSMAVDAARRGPGITAAGDPRVTRMGRFLRRTKLDELPQLLNVLCGHMSLVGPRPEDPRYVALYTPQQRQILQVRPGMTSAATFAYRQEEQLLVGENWEDTYCHQVLPAKLAIDLEYIHKRTLLSDLQIVMRTILALVKRAP